MLLHDQGMLERIGFGFLELAALGEIALDAALG